jgi:hypothetical protein
MQAAIIVFLVYLSLLPTLHLNNYVKMKYGKLWLTVIARGLYIFTGGIALILILRGLDLVSKAFPFEFLSL